MKPNVEHSENQVAQELRVELEGLDGKNSATRHAGYTRIQEEILGDPSVLPGAIEALQNGLADLPYADKILGLVQKEERLLPRLEEPEYLAGVLTHLDGEYSEWAQDLFLRWAAKPLKNFTETPESTKNTVERYTRMIFSFAQALRAMDEAGYDAAVEKAITLWKDHLVRPEIEDLSPFDFLFFSPYLPEVDIRYQGAVALSTLTILEDIHQKENFPFDDQMVKHQQQKAAKMARLLAGLELHDELYEYQKTIRLFDKTVKVYLETEGGMLFFPSLWLDDPHAQYLMQKYYDMTVSWLIGQGHEAEVIFFPGNLPVVMSSLKELDVSETKKDLEKIALRLHLKNDPSAHISPQPTREEIAYIGNLLLPSFEKEAMAQSWEKDLQRVQRGWRALSIRGNVIKFDQEEDEPIRQMGLSQILYKPVSGGVDVQISFGVWHVNIKLDHNYRPVSLDHVPPEYQDCLMAHIYVYLAEIKGSDVKYEKVVYQKKPLGGDTEEEQDEEVPYGYHVDPYLKVLTLGHHASLGEEALVDARFHFGIDLKLLNEMLVHAQESHQDIETTLTQLGVSGDERETYAIRLRTAFDRILLRPESKNRQGKYYMITYVSPYTAENTPSEPRVMHMPEVGRRLLQLHMASSAS